MAASSWGGSEELWSLAASRLKAEGRDVRASTTWWPEVDLRLQQLKLQGVEVAMRSHDRNHSLSARAVRGIVRRIRPHRDPYAEAIAAASPDVVVISNGSSWPSREAAEACLKSAVPYVTIAHANNIEWYPSSDEALLLRSYFQSARACLFVCDGNRRLVETQIGMVLQNAQIVRNPFSANYSTPLPWPRASGGGNPFRFACVARLHAPSKGHDILFETLAGEKWKDRNWTLSLFGEGPHRDTFERLVKIHDLGARVKFFGHVSNIENVWREHHLFLLASRYEGLPISIVEAQLCGRPVVVTDVGGNAEIVVDGHTGFVAKAPTPYLFSEALERAWASRNEWKGIGERAAEFVRKQIPEDPVGEFVRVIDGIKA